MTRHLVGKSPDNKLAIESVAEDSRYLCLSMNRGFRDGKVLKEEVRIDNVDAAEDFIRDLCNAANEVFLGHYFGLTVSISKEQP